MVRVRAAVTAWRTARDVDAYVRQRAWHWAQRGNYALATDYVLRILNRHPRDAFALTVGAAVAQRTGQGELHDKCVEAQRRLCFVKGVDSITALLPSRSNHNNDDDDAAAAAAAATTTHDAASTTRAWRPCAEDVHMWLHDDANTATSTSSHDSNNSNNNANDMNAVAADDDAQRVEQLTVRESEALATTQRRVRAAALRVVAASGAQQQQQQQLSAATRQQPLVELLLPAGSTYGRGLYATRHIAARTALLYDAPALVQRSSDAYCAHCLAPLGFVSAATATATAAATTTATTTSRGEADEERTRTADSDGTTSFVLCPHCVHESYCSERCRDAAWRRYHACCCASRNPAYAAWQSAMWQTVTQQQQGSSSSSSSHSGSQQQAVTTEAVLQDVSSAARAAVSCLAVGKMCAMATMQQQHPCALRALRHLRGVADYDASTALSDVGALAVTLASALRQTHLYMEEVLSLFALLQTNEVMLPGGVALYPVLSLLNHSCEPNCRLVPATHVRGLSHDTHTTRTRGERDDGGGGGVDADDETDEDDDAAAGSMCSAYVLAAARDIRDGEQLFVDYNAHLTSRLHYDDRKALCAQRHFECYCARCVRRQ